VFWNCKQISKTLFYKLNVLLVVLDTRSNDKAFLGSNVIHDELLKNTGIKVANVTFQSEEWHAEGLVTKGSS